MNEITENINKMKKAIVILIVLCVTIPITGAYAQKAITLEGAINTALKKKPMPNWFKFSQHFYHN